MNISQRLMVVAMVSASLCDPRSIASAQSLTGTIRAGGVPVPGVFVSLIGERDSTLARAMTNSAGSYRLTTQSEGLYRIRTLRIGFRPEISAEVRLIASQTAVLDVNLAAIPVALAAVRVLGGTACSGDAGVSDAATFEVWEQARAALAATLMSGERDEAIFRRIVYDRTLDAAGRRQLGEDARLVTDGAAETWKAAPVEALRQVGYVIESDDSTIFRAPGLDMLASDAFVTDHCFRLTEAGARIGVAFDPTRERRRVSGISGTLWLDRESAELRSLDYRYVNVRSEISDARAGGNAEFARLSYGNWVITSWAIRMPVVELRQAPSVVRGAPAADLRPVVTSMREAGGLLALVTRRGSAGDTLWAAPGVAVSGTIADSTTGAAIEAAEVQLAEAPGPTARTDVRGAFELNGVVPGSYTLRIRTPSLDSVNAVHTVPLLVTGTTGPTRVRVPDAAQLGRALCGSRLAATSQLRGMIFGTVTAGDSGARVGNAMLVAEWAEGDSVRWIESRTDARGDYRFCGVPVGRTIALRATTDSASASPVVAAIAANRRFARADLALDPGLPPTASLIGTVVADSSSPRPLEAAEVVITSLGRSVRTDARGAFRLRDIPTGTHEVVVRKPGYGAAVAQLTFFSNAVVQRRVVLTAMTTLDEVVVTAERRDPVMRLFEENRRLGLGQFMTRADLAKHDGGARRLGDLLREMKSVEVISQGSRAWVSTRRGQKSIMKRCTPLDGARAEGRLGGAGGDAVDCAGCYPVVYLNRTVLYNGGPGALAPNVSEFTPEQVEAIELYVGPAQVPSEYSGLNTHCGVLVIHTRR